MRKSFKDRLAALEALEAKTLAAWWDLAEPHSAADADALSDEDVIESALFALSRQHLGFSIYSADNRNCIGVRWCLPEHSPSYWRRIAERADALRLASGRVWLPANREQLCAALSALECGELSVRAPIGPTHAVWFGSGGESVALDDPRWPQCNTLRNVLDAIQIQTGGPYIETTEAARAVMAELLTTIEQEGPHDN